MVLYRSSTVVHVPVEQPIKNWQGLGSGSYSELQGLAPEHFNTQCAGVRDHTTDLCITGATTTWAPDGEGSAANQWNGDDWRLTTITLLSTVDTGSKLLMLPLHQQHGWAGSPRHEPIHSCTDFKRCCWIHISVHPQKQYKRTLHPPPAPDTHYGYKQGLFC